MFATELVLDADTVTVRVAGELDMATAPLLTMALASAVNETPATLVIDVAGMTFIDSQGFAVLAELRSELLANEGPALVIANVPPRIERLFKLLRLDAVFTFDPPLG